MRHSNYPQQYHNIRIQYIYYDVVNHNEIAETIVHQIHYDKIIECLYQKSFVIRKEDLIYLLKDDGARFFENSLRIYEPSEDNYFQIPDDWELEVDEAEPEFSLLLWIKSNNPTVSKKLEDMSTELQTLRVHLSSTQEESKTNSEKFKNEIEKLRLLNQVIFTQLAKIHEKALLPPGNGGGGDPNFSPRPRPITGPTDPPYNPAPKSRGQIDIALMYSEPLVKRDAIGIVSLGDPVDYEEECNKLLDLLKSKEKRIDVSFEIATMENLIKVLSIFPKILHIICHGEFSKENNMFYLCFEEEGELKELYSRDLKKILAEVELKTSIVFVNACHSEEVAKVFQEAGIPCVIAVQSELKIEDHVAQKFSETFYWQIFEGKSVREAFKLARITASGKEIYTCCCAHSHKPDCEWYKLAKEEGFEKAHHLHNPTCTSCRYNNKFIHNTNCNWVQDFRMYVCGIFDVPDEDTVHACCCSPEYPHNEVMKFKLLCSDEGFEKEPLFQDRERGKVTIKSYHSCVDQKFPVKRLMGRNKELYEMYEALVDKEKKFVNLYGIEGVGKSSIVKQISNYLFERGYFKDKIAIIILERTPSITHFRSDLFKEVSGAYDLKSFCEAIKNNRVLFILEKADRLLKQDAEHFRHDLAYITDFSANVKFIIITNEAMSLKLGGAVFVRMRELKKIDVAKLLCKNAYSFLKWDERNIYNLQQHGIFDLIPLTPQGVWSVSEKLRHGNSLDDIERDMLMEREQNDRNPINELDEAIKMTLDEIKDMDDNAYQLLIFLCLFPSGLSYQDLEELELQQRIPPNWKFILLSFLTANMHHDENQGGTPGETPGGPMDTIDRNSFKPDSYIWINIIKEPSSGEIYFVPTQFLTRYIENNLIEDSLDQNIKKLEYMTILSLAIIEQMKRSNGYHEKLVEFSVASTYGIWKVQSGRIFDIYEKRNKIRYIDSLANDANAIKKLFQAHEANFICCIEPKIVQDILQIDETKQEHIIEIIEVLYLSIPTLFKLIQGRETETIELARRAGTLIEFLGEKEDPHLQILEAKLNLFLTALYLEDKVNPAEHLPLVKVQLGLLTEQEGKIQHEEMRKAISSEISFAKAVAMYKEYKTVRKKKDIAFKEIKQILTTSKCNLKDHQLFDVCRAKITLVECKARELYNKKDVEKELLQELNSAQDIFSHYGSKNLLMKFHYIFACLKVDLEKRRMKAPENTLDDIRQITQRLAKIKNYHLLQYALRLAKDIKDKSYEAKIKRQIDSINKEIRFGYFNVIIFMRASPIVDFKEPNHEMVTVGFNTKIKSDFKYEVFETLFRKQKVLNLKFEHLTKENLTDCLQSGCRILQLTCNHAEDNSLCIEGELGKLDRIPFDELRDLFLPNVPFSGENTLALGLQGEYKALDVLILAVKGDTALADFFVNLGIPHVITFEFSKPEINIRQKVYEDECIEKFCTYFYEELILQKSVSEAFESSYDKALNYLGESYFEGNIGKNVNNIIGTGPVLLPKDSPHNDVLFSESTFPLMPGRVEDISSMRYPNSINILYLPFTGRKTDMYKVAEMVCQNKDFLVLYGAQGVGKTRFVLELGHYLLTRSKFTHGVFYIPLKRLKATNLAAPELIDLLKETTGIEIQKVMSNSFKGKNMLLLFDDFDLFYGKDAEFPRIIFKTLKECKIACILIQRTKKENEENGEQADAKDDNHNKEDIEEILKGASEWTLEPFSNDELGQILLSLVNIQQPIDDMEKIKENEAVKSAEGNPYLLIQSLIERKIQIGDKVLEVSKDYNDIMHFEMEYLDITKSPFLSSSVSQVPLNKFGSSVYYDPTTKIGRGISSISDTRAFLNASNSGAERKTSREFDSLKSPRVYNLRTQSAHRMALGESLTVPTSNRRSQRYLFDNSRSYLEESPPVGKKDKANDKWAEYHYLQGVELRRNLRDYEEEKVAGDHSRRHQQYRKEEEKEEDEDSERPSIDSGLEGLDSFHDVHGSEHSTGLERIRENSDG